MLLIVALVFIISVRDSTSAKTPTSCKRPSYVDVELNYSLPIRAPCGEFRLSNGSVITKIPKLIPVPLMQRCQRDGIPAGHRICRRPDCLSGPCQNGWCEETMEGYLCHCSDGFSGKDCSIVDRRPTESPLHASNVTELNATASSTLSSTQEVSQQSQTIWSSLYTSFTSCMSTDATPESTETTTETTEMTPVLTETAPMSTETTTLSTETGNPDDFHTLIVCEKGSQNITCPLGKDFNIMSANYGRTNSTVCPYHDPAAMVKTDCFLDVRMEIRCQSTSAPCNIVVNNKLFTDPCAGVFKYLNVTYKCHGPV